MRPKQSGHSGRLRILLALLSVLLVGAAADLRSSAAQAGAGVGPSDQGVLAPQTPGTYALNLQTGAVVNAGPLSEFNSPMPAAWSPDGTKLAVAAAAEWARGSRRYSDRRRRLRRGHDSSSPAR